MSHIMFEHNVVLLYPIKYSLIRIAKIVLKWILEHCFSYLHQHK